MSATPTYPIPEGGSQRVQPTTVDGNGRPRARLGDVDDAAVMLKLSPKTVRRLIDGGKFPGVCRIGRLVRIDLEVLELWVGQGCPPMSRFRAKGGATA